MVMCITPLLMELWQHCLQDVGKLPFAFPCPVNGVVHDGMGSYAHFHDAFFALNRRFPALFTGQGCYSCLALLVRLSAALSALNTG